MHDIAIKRVAGDAKLERAGVVVLQAHITEYLNRLASLGVAGVRIDASKHMNHWDVGSILQVLPVLQADAFVKTVPPFLNC